MATANGRRPQRGQQAQQSGQQQTIDLADRTPPYDLRAERGLLGSMMLLTDVIDEVLPLVRAEDFYDEAHQRLYHHITAQHDASRRFDEIVLLERIKRAGDFEKVGGAAYLSKVIHETPNAAHANYYAEIVRDKSVLRRLIFETTAVLRGAFDSQQSGPDLVAQAEASLARISDSTLIGQPTRTLTELVHESMDALEQRMVSGESRLLDVGLDAFAECMGLVPGGVTILAGRASMGKTACAMTIANNVARRGGRVFITSLEMTAMELCDRLLCMRSMVPFHMMARGRISLEQRQRLVEAAGGIHGLPIIIDDRPGQTVAQIAAAVRREHRRAPLSLIVIDYAQLIEPDDHRVDRVEQLAKISRGIKRLARQSNVPVMPLVQVNRSSESNADLRPRLHQLKGSGSWEEDADAVAFVFRPHFNAETGQVTVEIRPGEGEPAEIIMAKNRNGPRASHEALWFKDSMSWQNKAGPEYSTPAERETHF